MQYHLPLTSYASLSKSNGIQVATDFNHAETASALSNGFMQALTEIQQAGPSSKSMEEHSANTTPSDFLLVVDVFKSKTPALACKGLQLSALQAAIDRKAAGSSWADLV